MAEPQLLCIPKHFHTADEALATARQLNLTNVLIISEREDGKLVFLDNDLNNAQANWLLDRMKMLLHMPNYFKEVD